MGTPGKLTAFPNGVSSFGVPVMPVASFAIAPPFLSAGAGKVIWVGNATGLPAGDGSSPMYPCSSLLTATTGGLAKTNGQPNCTIYILPGHIESIAASTNMSTLAGAGAIGTQIIGIGVGRMRPRFNWTAAASALLTNLQGTWIRNCFLDLNNTAATVVTAAITMSAADCGWDTVEFFPNTSATQLTTTAITIASGANRCAFVGSIANSETFATNPTNFITTTAAVDALTMIDCKWQTAVNTTTNGVVNLANAPTNVYMENVSCMNKKASSTVSMIASASTTGTINAGTQSITNATGGATAISTPGNLNMHYVRGGVIGKASIDITPQSG